ncbi:ATP-binding protein [Streptomyces sp. NPDC101115]|uniref:ATP-binding protein n=1 Tax=Streptomyces sp. NPDC101115 TaxID=3366106 RepID=UPI0037FC63E9
MLGEELAVRDERRFRQGLLLSKLPHHKTIDDYDFSSRPELGPRKVKDLATAILDRLLHHCGVISINGPSYLLKNRLAALDGDAEVA